MELNVTFCIEIAMISILFPFLNFAIFGPLGRVFAERERLTLGKRRNIEKTLIEINKQKIYIKEQMDMKLYDLIESYKRFQHDHAEDQKKKIKLAHNSYKNKHDEILIKLEEELDEAITILSKEKHILAGMIYDRLHKN